MKILHFDEVDSTQKFLIQKMSGEWKLEEDILISTAKQTKGVGRTGTSWDTYKNALAFSYTINPCPNIPLTTLEMGILLVEFFNEYYQAQLKLKWPNDLLTKRNEKCGGLIASYISKKCLVLGVGLNLLIKEEEKNLGHNYKVPSGEISVESNISSLLKKGFKSEIPIEIYHYILNHRIPEINIKEKWQQYCSHMNKKVMIKDCTGETIGFFKGINSNGEAIIEQAPQEYSCMSSGSLFLL